MIYSTERGVKRRLVANDNKPLPDTISETAGEKQMADKVRRLEAKIEWLLDQFENPPNPETQEELENRACDDKETQTPSTQEERFKEYIEKPPEQIKPGTTYTEVEKSK